MITPIAGISRVTGNNHRLLGGSFEHPYGVH
jgi:hypothetical protein